MQEGLPMTKSLQFVHFLCLFSWVSPQVHPPAFGGYHQMPELQAQCSLLVPVPSWDESSSSVMFWAGCVVEFHLQKKIS